MKKKFSTAWKASKQPRKQRKYRANAPLHLRKKFVSVNLSKDLREKEKKRNIPIHKGDVVKIMRGKFKGKKGKILEVNLKDLRVVVEGIQVKKQDGSKAHIKLQPSNLQIIELSERTKKTFTEEKMEEKSKTKQINKKAKISKEEVKPTDKK